MQILVFSAKIVVFAYPQLFLRLLLELGGGPAQDPDGQQCFFYKSSFVAKWHVSKLLPMLIQKKLSWLIDLLCHVCSVALLNVPAAGALVRLPVFVKNKGMGT